MVKKDIKENLSAALVLPRIIAKTLGYDTPLELLDLLKIDAGYEYKYDSDSSNFMQIILKRFKAIHVEDPFNILTEEKLLKYDLNIKEHFAVVNKKRDITLKVYQYVSLLFTEIYLDHYFSLKKAKDTEAFIQFLNNGMKKILLYKDIEEYTKDDLEKICFWMATGSGKTIIMHINYLQYFYYNNNINNVILITPNEDLSAQHKKQLSKSDINSIEISKENHRTLTKDVKIIDINKLAERSQIKRIDYRSFGENNLILVDEGHRGASGESWLKYRKNIAKEGFTFEYSATFQDIEKDKSTMSDYKKTILFDYSYKYYHKDGYGKDYMITNSGSEDNKQYDLLMMLGNLLSFYEQKKLFHKNKKELETIHLIEEPLWLLVGSKVVETEKDKLDDSTNSDILKFIEFLNKLKRDKTTIKKEIKAILENKIPLVNNDNNQPFFQDKLIYLRAIIQKEFNNNIDDLLEDIFKIVFYSKNDESELVLVDIKESDGEVGLQFRSSESYFGLIYVGKGNDKKIIETAKEKKILTSEQSIKTSLFRTLNQHISHPLNILIGAKKFIEGWDNYRISSMLLMNFAKSKGVSAIQLFGRGVRLHGYNNTMKRSDASKPPIQSEDLKKNLPIIETLNVFGIHANYMEAFRGELEQDIDFYIEKELEIDNSNFFKIKEDLKCIKKDSDAEESFKQNNTVTLSGIKLITINLDQHLKSISINAESTTKVFHSVNKEKIINKNYAELVSWEDIISEVRRFKKLNEYRNVSLLNNSALKKILLEDVEVSFTGSEEYLKSISDHSLLREYLQNIYVEILKKHITYNYNKAYKKHYDTRIELTEISEKDLPSSYKIKIYLDAKKETKGQYSRVLKILADNKSKIVNIKDLEKELEKNLISKDKLVVEIDQHLYVPLLIAADDGSYSLNPAGLNKGEVSFLNKVKIFIQQECFKNMTFAILRNPANTGFGYYLEDQTYYPDFIMWVITEEMQKIIFLDPKGLGHFSEEIAQKIDFNKRIKEIETLIKKQNPHENVELYSFILSVTEKSTLPKEISENIEHRGVYFDKDPKYLDKIFKVIGIY